MRKAVRIGLVAVAAVVGSAFVASSPARGDVSFHGRFRGPHGAFSIGIGSPSFPVGSRVPYGHRVFSRPRFGDGFWSPVFVCRSHRVRHAHWVPVRRHRARWIVVERPVVVVEKRGDDDGYDHGYDYDRYGYERYDDGYRYEDGYDGSYDRYSGSRHKCWEACPVHHPRRHRDRYDDWDD